MTPLQSKLSTLWNALSDQGKKASIFGFSRKFYPLYAAKLGADKDHIEEYFDVKDTEVLPGTPDYSGKDPITGSLYFVGRLIVTLDPDVTARIFLKYCLDGKESWWISVRGPRGKMYDQLFREYFNDETAKDPR